MLIPKRCREERIEQLHVLLVAQPLGLLITHGIGGLQASAVPFMLYPDEGKFGDLRAHVARDGVPQ